MLDSFFGFFFFSFLLWVDKGLGVILMVLALGQRMEMELCIPTFFECLS